jgi:hypothetical protein
VAIDLAPWSSAQMVGAEIEKAVIAVANEAKLEVVGSLTAINGKGSGAEIS